MKQILLSMLLLPAFTICFAQIKTVKTGTQQQTLKTEGTNTVVPKLPDLRISAATVTAVSTSPGAYKLTIRCTIKNDGNAAISLANISLQGLIAPENYIDRPLNYTGYDVGCGTTGGQERETLLPGASIVKEYYCFNRVLSPSNKPVYVLLINHWSDIKEHNKENNRQNVYITFQ